MSYRTILAVINEHTGSTVSARYAIMLAASCGAELVLYSAHEAPGDAVTALHTERHIDHLFGEALTVNVAVRRISETGSFSTLLLHRIQAEGVDLVFYPLTPGERYGATLQQHTAHYLLRLVRADLAVMRIMHMGKPHPRRILVPVSGVISDREPRSRFLAALARAFNSQVTLFHRPAAGKQGSPKDLILLRDELLRQDLSVLERSGTGGIARSIAVEAVSHHNDLIVVGASERSTLRRLLFGNPAGDVMFQPPCNAILFRPARLIP